jgi:hypothetical protein
MAEDAEQREHPVFGVLLWEPQYAFWSAKVPRPGGGQLDVIIEPDEEDRVAFLKEAAKLFEWAMKNEQRMLARAMKEELVELYNGTWRRNDQPELTATELTQRLDWQLLTISGNGIVPVEYCYAAGNLFGDHAVAVEIDDTRAFSGTDLRG